MELAETQKEEIEQAAKWWLLLTEVRTEIETMMLSLCLKGRREFQHIRGHLQADTDTTGMCEGRQEAERHRGEREEGWR